MGRAGQWVGMRVQSARETHMDFWVASKTTATGSEPLRAEPNGFGVHLLDRSDTLSYVHRQLVIALRSQAAIVTVAILAQGTSWAVAVTQAFLLPGSFLVKRALDRRA